jgi:hypothetical protein
LLWQATILTLSASTVFVLSSLNLTSLIMNVQTSSQKRYVSRCPCRDVVSTTRDLVVLHQIHTLNVILAFTFSPSTVDMLWSKFWRMRIANCGSIRREEIRSSRVSARARPMLHKFVNIITERNVERGVHTRSYGRVHRRWSSLRSPC